MPVIIDGNNLLHAAKPAALAGLDERGLCRALGRTRWRQEGARVVLDGEPGTLGRLASPVAEVELLYSGAKRTADEVIERMINESTAPRRLVVVSSDRAVQRAARRRRATVWSSERFAHELVAAMRQDHAKADPGAAVDATLTQAQVDDWLATFGIDSDEVQEQRGEADDEDASKHWPPW